MILLAWLLACRPDAPVPADVAAWRSVVAAEEPSGGPVVAPVVDERAWRVGVGHTIVRSGTGGAREELPLPGEPCKDSHRRHCPTWSVLAEGDAPWVTDGLDLHRWRGDAWERVLRELDPGRYHSRIALATGREGEAVVAVVRELPDGSLLPERTTLIARLQSADGWVGDELEGSPRAGPPWIRDTGVLQGQVAPATAFHRGEAFIAWADGGALRVFVLEPAEGLVELPAPAGPEGDASQPTFGVDDDDRLLLAWRHAPRVGDRWLVSQIQVRAWDGGRWHPVGDAGARGVSDSDGRAEAPRLLRSADGETRVAWTEEGRRYEARWDGATWQRHAPPSGIPEPVHPADAPRLAAAPGILALGWKEEPVQYPMREARLRGWIHGAQGWVALPLLDEQVLWSWDLAVESSGRATVLWHGRPAAPEVWRAEPGAGWQSLGAPDLPRRASGNVHARLALGPEGAPWIAVGEADTALWRWADGAWVDEGAGPGDPMALHVDGRGRPMLAWSEETLAGYRAVHVRVRDGGAWVPVGEDAACNSVDASATDVALTLRDGAPASLAWREHRGPGETFVVACRWTGAAWERLPPADARVGATGATWGLAQLQGGPLLAWVEGPEGDQRVRAAWWSGQAWEALGTDGVIARCDPACAQLAVSERGVAWTERGARKTHIGAVLPGLERPPAPP